MTNIQIVLCLVGIILISESSASVRSRFTWQEGLRSRLSKQIADRIPSNYSTTPLPDLLTSLNGTNCRNFGPDSPQWADRKAEIRELLEQSYYGSFPRPPPPAITEWHTVNSTETRGFVDEWYSVTFATPGEPTTLEVEAMWPPESLCGAPDGSSPPCPVFMTQTNHRRWSIIAAARGYLAVTYPGSDNNCADGSQCREGDPTAGFKRVDPSATFQLIARRAYLASRIVDLLLKIDSDRRASPKTGSSPSAGAASSRALNASAIGITGHSRNGKQSLLAAAWDDRIAAVADSSSGVPAFSTYRFSSGNTFSETPSSYWPGPWWLPSLVDMAGVEDTNPIDSHGLLALIAPRPVLHANAWTDNCDPSFGIETTYLAGLETYGFVGGAGGAGRANLRLDHRPGDHHGWETPHRYVDWFDWHFEYHPLGRPGYTYDERWPETSSLLHRGFTWQAWADRQTGPPALPPANSSRLERFGWLWGEAPGGATGAPWSPGGVYDSFPYVDVMLNHDKDVLGARDTVVVKQGAAAGAAGSSTGAKGQGGGRGRGSSAAQGTQRSTGAGSDNATVRVNVNLGAYVKGDMFFAPESAVGRRLDAAGNGRPGVVFLHPLSYQRGFVEGYPHAPESIIKRLATAAGAVVVTFDQLGFSMRQHEGRDFYQRFSRWSRLGRMAWDARSAVDLLAANTTRGSFRPAGRPDRLPEFPAVDPDRIYVVGYSVGGMAAVVAGALDGRVRGVASIAGLEPMADGGIDAPTGGNQRWYDWHAIAPRLGYFGGSDEGRAHDLSALPADWDDGLALVGCGGGDGQYPVVADRQVLLVAPQQDRYHRVGLVQAMAALARGKCSGHRSDRSSPTWLSVAAPDAVNELSAALVQPAVDFISGSGQGEVVGAPRGAWHQ